jgi:hypothetical protein
MRTHFSIAGLTAAAVLTCGAGAQAATATTILYQFAALPGPVSTCTWFANHQNDPDLGSIARSVDLLYNVVRLRAGTPVTVTNIGQSADATPYAEFSFNGKTVCTAVDALTPVSGLPIMPESSIEALALPPIDNLTVPPAPPPAHP